MSFRGFNRFSKERVLCFEKKNIIGRVGVFGFNEKGLKSRERVVKLRTKEG